MTRAKFLAVTAALLTCAAGFPGTALGQYTPDQNVPTVEGVCVSNCGTSSSNSTSTGDTWGTQLGLALRSWVGRQVSGEASRDRASATNHDAVAAQQAGNLDEALRLYRQAHRQNTGSLIIRANLMTALVLVAWRDFQNRPNTTALSYVERLLDEMDGLRDPAVAAQAPDYNDILAAAARIRDSIESVRAGERQAAENARALGAASRRISGIASDLAGQLNDSRSAASTTGLGFGDPSEAADLRDAPNEAVSLVARATLPPNIPPFQEVDNSPGREAWLRGIDAAARGDWELAAAWFGTARLRDPNNPALGRAVELAEWTRNFYRTNARRPADQQGVVAQRTEMESALRVPRDEDLALLFRDIQSDPALRVPRDEDLSLLFASGDPPPSPRLTPEQQRRADLYRDTLQMLPPEDLDFMAPDPVTAREEMIGQLAGGVRQGLAQRGRGISNGDWTDHLAPEVRGMLADLREALPAPTQGPMNYTSDLLTAAAMDRVDVAVGDAAVSLLLLGDLAGAERAIAQGMSWEVGATSSAQYRRAYELVRSWRGYTAINGLSGLAPGGEVQPVH